MAAIWVVFGHLAVIPNNDKWPMDIRGSNLGPQVRIPWYLRSVVRIEQEVTDSNLKNVNLEKIGRNWFTNRVVDNWNKLSQLVVSSQTIGSFKKGLDGYMDGNERWMLVIRKYWSNRNYQVQTSGLFVASLYSYVLMKIRFFNHSIFLTLYNALQILPQKFVQITSNSHAARLQKKTQIFNMERY